MVPISKTINEVYDEYKDDVVFYILLLLEKVYLVNFFNYILYNAC